MRSSKFFFEPMKSYRVQELIKFDSFHSREEVTINNFRCSKIESDPNLKSSYLRYKNLENLVYLEVLYSNESIFLSSSPYIFRHEICSIMRTEHTWVFIKIIYYDVVIYTQYLYIIFSDNAFPADELMPLSCKGRIRGVSESRGDMDDILGK